MDDVPQPDDKGYSVDWDSAWSNELTKRQTGETQWRPEGREPVSEQSVRDARVRKGADDAMATVQAWSGDWKLWVGVLLAASVLTAVATHSQAPDAYSV